MARARIKKGAPGRSVIAEFVQQGLDPSTADQIVDDAIRSARSRAAGLLAFGVAFAALGLVVTIASYAAATESPSGGTYLIWWGPVLAGAITALFALVRLAGIQR